MPALYGDFQVHEVARKCQWAARPFEPVPIIHVSHKGLIELGISNWVGIFKPNAKNIIDEPSIESHIRCPFRNDCVLVWGVEECGKWRGWRDTHAGSGRLSPEGVPKAEDIVFEYQVEGGDEGFWMVMFIPRVEVISDDF